MATKEKRYIDEEKNKVLLIGSSNEFETFFKSPSWSLSYDFPYNPDPLCSGNNYDTYDEMIIDDQVKSAISIKKDMVINTGWKIVGESQEVNDEIKKILENINSDDSIDNSFEDCLRDILSSYEYGFSLTEPVFEVIDSRYIYKKLKTRAPHSFTFYLDDFGNVIEIKQSTPRQEKSYKPNIFLHHGYNMTFGNPYGTSDLRGAYNAWKAKCFFRKFFAIYVEKFAVPTVVGSYDKSLTTDEAESFHDILKSIQNATSIVIPNDVKVEFMQSARDASDIYIKGLDYYNMQIARSILVPDLMGISGTATGGGSFALGKEQFKVFLATIKKDRENLQRKITLKLIRPIVNANYGDIDCSFEFVPYTHDDIIEYIKIWVQAVSSKVFDPSDEEINYFRSVTGFPEGEVNRVAVQPNPFNPFQKPTEQPQEKVIQKDISEDDKEYKYRVLTPYEKKIDYELIQNTWDKEEKRILPNIIRQMKLITNDLVDQVRDKNILNKFNPDRIEAIRPKYLRQMNGLFKNYYVDLYNSSLDEARKEILPNGNKRYTVDLLPDEFLDLLTVEAFKTVGDYSFETTKAVKNIVIQAVKDGKSEAETLRLIKDKLDNTSETWANTVIRTKTTEIYNESRKRFFENDPIASQIVEAYQWSAILDDRTSDICQYLDGKIFSIGELSDWVKPPAHFNCRSVLVPITKFEDYTVNKSSDFDEDKLKGKGGNLLILGGGTKKLSIENKSNLTYSGEFFTSGEHVIIASAGINRFINILSINVNNLDLLKPVIIAFKEGDSQELKYKSLIDKSGGLFQKEFTLNEWIVNNQDIKIVLFGDVKIGLTIEYVILDENMQRVF